jgi:hypothetical protein
VFEQTAGIVECHLAQTGVFLAGEERLALAPQGLMGVHPGAVVAEERLGHEAGGLAVFLGHVFDDVFVNHHPVGGGDQRTETIVNFGLAGGGDFMVLALDLDAEFFHHQAHLGADVLLGVGGRDREVPFLVADFVAEVGHFITARVPDAFLAVNGVERAVGLGIKLDIVKDEKFRLGPDKRLVGDARGDKIFLGALGDAARIAGVRFPGAGLGDGAGQAQRRDGTEGINERRVRVGHRQHVGSLNAFPAADAGAVKAQSLGKGIFI